MTENSFGTCCLPLAYLGLSIYIGPTELPRHSLCYSVYVTLMQAVSASLLAINIATNRLRSLHLRNACEAMQGLLSKPCSGANALSFQAVSVPEPL